MDQTDQSSTAAEITTDILDASNKKSTQGQPVLKGVVALLSLILLVYLIQIQIQSTLQKQKVLKQVLAVAVQKENPGFPVRLKIPIINVDASIEYVGISSKGAMEVPNNTTDVGWFKFGARPGENGSAVIAGHFDGENGEAGVFNNLHKLKKGDELYIQYGTGTSISFVVRESRTYDPGYAEDVFTRNDSAYLNLITCDGVWDEAKKNYSKRLVVFADLMH